MSQTQRHYGFAQVPRLVLRGDKFKDLTLIEKGLYASLKDICGDDGECFYTFRNLAKEIHTSISTLSRYIPKLVNAGLITAEKKVRSVNKHEVFHIRIVSIWEENDTLYRPLDAKNGFTEKQIIVSDRNNNDVDTKIVASRNNSVSDRNKNSDDQAQDCFYLNDRIRSNNNNLSEEDLYVNADALTPTPSQENENAYPQENTSSQHQQASTVDNSASERLRIANTEPQGSASIGMPIRNTDSLFDNTSSAPDKAKPNELSTKQAEAKKQKEPLKVKIEHVYEVFDTLFRELMNDPSYKEPRTDKSTKAIKALIQADATDERIRFVLMDIWNDKDDFWQKHRTITSVASQYSTRVSKMQTKTPSGALTNGSSNGQKPRPAALAPENIVNERKRKMLENTVTQRAEMDARKAARLAQARGE